MKTNIKSSALVTASILSLSLVFCDRVAGQTFTNLHSFSSTYSDVSGPMAELILSGNTLFGTTASGGTYANGTVFKVNTDGTGFETLHTFSANPYPGTNSDGALPLAGLVLAGNTLYGTASGGGIYGGGFGAIFKVNTDGTGFSVLHYFTAPSIYSTNSDGISPRATLILSENILYGTAIQGGLYGAGTVFSVNTDGSDFQTLHTFTAGTNSTSVNSDGQSPQSRLVLSGNTLYGTAFVGGTNGVGTVFSLNTDGTGFEVIHTCSYLSQYPEDMVLSGNTLYGTTEGINESGTLFAVNTDGTGFTNLFVFAGVNGNDSTEPQGTLALSGNTLYGTTEFGGITVSEFDPGYGTVFAINTNGTGYTTLYRFSNVSGSSYTNSDGAYPEAGVILSGNALYGATTAGGNSGNGTVFSLSFPAPELAISQAGTNIVLTWSSAIAAFYGGLSLQSTTNLAPPLVWSAVSPAPFISTNGQSIVTNELSGPMQFYRLGQ